MHARSRFGLVAVVLFVGGLAIGGGGTLIFGPNTGGYDTPRSVYIAQEATLDATIDSLTQADVLVVPAAFRLVAWATGWGQQIKPGHYRVAPGRSNYHLLDKLRRGLQDPVRLTVPPGVQRERLASVLGRRLEREPTAFRTALRDTSLAGDLGSTPGRLFGYMLPETYDLYWQTPPKTVVRRIKRGFDRFYERELAAGADSLGLTKRAVVTLASIVEWEALRDAEKPAIAGVYLNRLDRGWPLQADPTIQYVLLDTNGERVGRVLHEHLEIDHPYNTYQHQGLPPGPITNPSPSSLRAVAAPERHGYLYFAADGTGGHTFSRTLREHNRAAEKYQRMLDERR
ncbi:endolytic transglycosylase MltG [Salinibacter altiplanensis]|uniref:endolytic transglycosylase MltG n=1 Tax=Salinibacter altiplanensis TaxID=1803181 RepID=UPI000C9FF25E|nr:endolytic transglycosylase MltG [Salinibacter altiplanensis]